MPNHVARYGLPDGRKGRNAARDAEIIRLLRTGDWTLLQVANRYGITESRVSQICTRNGFSMADRHRAEAVERRRRVAKASEQAKRAKLEALAERDRVLTQMWIDGATTAVIGAALGMDQSVVGRRAKALGLQQRARGGWGSSRGSWYVHSDPLPRFQPPREPEPEAEELHERRVRQGKRKCWCGDAAPVECICGRRCCEDHAAMTVDGPRCAECMAAA